MEELRTGIYKHYKGGLNLVLGVAQHSETGEQLVVYVPLGVHSGARIKVRPYGMFLEQVSIGGKQLPRYHFIGDQVHPAVAGWYDKLSGYKGADRVDD